MIRKRSALKWMGIGFAVLLAFWIIGVNGYHMYGRHKLLQDYPPPGVMLNVGTHQMHMYCEGSGQPTVVLDAGATWFSVVAWDSVIDAIGSFTRVCAFDRSGLGYSERGPTTPDVESYVDDFHALVSASGEPPPYLLAGHSLGGGLIWLYAQERLDDIAGLVSIDGVPPGILAVESLSIYQDFPTLLRFLGLSVERLGVLNLGPVSRDQIDATALSLDVSELLNRAHFLNRSPIADVLTNPGLAAALEGVGSVGEVPVRLLAAGARNRDIYGDAADDAPLFWRVQDDASGLSTDGRVIELPGSSHFIQFDRPDVVVETVRELVDIYRAKH